MDKRVSQFLADAKALQLSVAEHNAVCELIIQNMQTIAHSQELQRVGKDLRLTSAEKSEGLHQLIVHMRRHPLLPVEHGLLSNFFFRLQAHRFLATCMASLLIVFSLGGSLAYAAEGALPGDLLYPLKVDVVEPLRGAFKRTQDESDEWKLQQLERRLEEAQALVVLQKKDPHLWEQVQKRIDHQVFLVEGQIQQLPTPSEKNGGQSAQDVKERVRRAAMQTELESTLVKYEARLKSSVEKHPVEPPVRAVMESLQKHREHVEEMPKKPESDDMDVLMFPPSARSSYGKPTSQNVSSAGRNDSFSTDSVSSLPGSDNENLTKPERLRVPAKLPSHSAESRPNQELKPDDNRFSQENSGAKKPVDVPARSYDEFLSNSSTEQKSPDFAVPRRFFLFPHMRSKKQETKPAVQLPQKTEIQKEAVESL